MSHDVSLARNQGAVGTAEPGTAVTWNAGTLRLWDAYFAVCALGVVALSLSAGSAEPIADRWLATGLLVAMSGWYVAFGRRIADTNPPLWQGLLFQGVLFAMFFVAIYAQGLVTFLLFALCPLVYMTVPMRAAHGVVALYAFAPAALVAMVGDLRALNVTVPIGAVILGISVVIAVTTARVERISDERGRLIEELNETRAEVARLSREAGVAEERQRLAGEIHDTVAQGLSSVVMLVEAADAELTTDPAKARAHLALAARTARENMDEARAIVGALTPSPLVRASLVQALQRLVARFGQYGTEVSLRVEGEPRALPTSTDVVLLRVAQESLTNVRRHAGAERASVRLHYGDDGVALDVADEGQGFDATALRSGYGLDAMRARVEQVGGRLTIHSAPGLGTTIRTEIDE